MTTKLKHDEDIKSIAVIGNFLPRQCGIATFTKDLVEGLSALSPDLNCWTVAMNDTLEGYPYPEKVRFEINQNILADYGIASQFLNISGANIVCLQHEFGIFGGSAGSHLLKLLGELHMPVVTTLHTVLKDPAPEYRDVMCKIGDLSDKLVVMSHKAEDFLENIYGIPREKIAFVHHGIPDMPFMDSSFNKDKFEVEGKKVLLTFGLLSPNKGIETVLQALPAVIEKHPDVVYIVLGRTHPHVLKSQGEAYRIMLQQMVHKLGINRNVIFQNSFVALRELGEFLGIADIYISPYPEEAQITSGTLAYAMGTGKAIISTPYWYAVEMLAEGRGKIVPFKHPNALAEQINALLDNDGQRHAMRKKAYTFTREALWKEVSQRYLEIFREVCQNRIRRHPRPRCSYIEDIEAITRFDLPEIKLDHLKAMTDDTGLLQHTSHTIPDRAYGYCTDDNARALLVAVLGQKGLPANGFGLDAYLGKFSGDSDARRIRDILADRLFVQFKDHGTKDWPWLEEALNYANAKLPQALILSGNRMQRSDMVNMGLNSLKWLLAIQTDDHHFAPIGSNGWYQKGGKRARFDQQPIEAKAMVEACVEAYNITRDRQWFENSVMSFNRFLGHNDLNMPLYDPQDRRLPGRAHGGRHQPESGRGVHAGMAFVFADLAEALCR
nr:glycosyltransferase family 4 protein [uncultured Desulfobacter sp.]